MQWDKDTVWSELQVPPGVDRQLVIDSIVLEAAELELLYPAYDTCQHAIGIWSRRRLPIWTKLFATTQLEYNPIENYDRMEDWTDKEKTDGWDNKDTTNHVTQSSDTTTSGHDSGLSTTSVKGFDAGEFVEREQVETSNNTNANSDTNSSQDATTGETGQHGDTRDYTRTGRAHGNIGVTTTQQMITQEREVSEFDIYSYIANDFVTNLCLGVY